MTQNFTDVFSIDDVTPDNGDVINYRIHIALSKGDEIFIEGYKGFDNVLRVTKVFNAEVSMLAVCLTWLAVHEERVIQSIREFYSKKYL